MAFVVGVQLYTAVAPSAAPEAPIAAETLARKPGVVDPLPVTVTAPAAAVDTSDLDRRIAFWQARADANPQSEQEWIYIGDLRDLKARLTGDVAHYIEAQQAYERAIGIAPNSVSAHSGNARLLATLHDFENAVVEATRVLQLDPSADEALGVIFDASIELGHLDNARLALDRLAERVNTPALFVREARLAFFSGDTDGAIAHARRAVSSAEEEQAPISLVAFYRFALGEYELLNGDPDAAEVEYDAALTQFPGYTAAIYGKSRVAFARGHIDDAIGLLETLPKNLSRPDMLAFLGDLYALSGDAPAATQHHELADRAAKAAAIGDRLIFGREYALFLADHDRDVDGALALAQPEVTPTDGYGADTLAWVLHKAGRANEALVAARSAVGYGIPDPIVMIHAGLIELEAGDPAAGRALLERGLALNPTASPLVIEEARRALGIQEAPRSAAIPANSGVATLNQVGIARCSANTRQTGIS